MKKLILTTSLVALVAASSFAQGTISFKTSVAKDPVVFATDSTTASLAYVATDGTAGSFGTVNYIIYAAPTGTVAPTTGAQGTPLTFGAGWTAVPVSSPVYGGAGLISAQTITLPASASLPGSAAEVEIVAYTGTLANPTLYGYAGESFNGGQSFTFGGFSGLVSGNPALEWVNPTGNPAGSPATPGAIPTQAAGLGALVLLPPVPEPSTIALGGMAAAALLAFRRRK